MGGSCQDWGLISGGRWEDSNS